VTNTETTFVTLPLGVAPTGMAFDPTGEFLFVAVSPINAPSGIDVTTVRLNVEENQLVNAFGEFGICLGGLKGTP
jgi:DNA-binding beta-propeller fold protein YncE